ncbi:MAG: F0F1 ATP synthase subunit A [Alphaproteobacteria bacterium]|nr:F0F1 ATP synthase subunit A [Alphaproteobacteria bacterium]
MVFHWSEHLIHVSWVFQAALVAGLSMLWMAYGVRKRLADPAAGVLPDEGVTIRNMVEVIIEGLAGMASERMGPNWRKYFPLVGTMFFFILVSNLMGLVPGLDGSTSDANVTWAWAAIAWFFYTAIGIAEHKGKYIVKFLGPSFFERDIGGKHVHFRLLAPVFFILEIPLDLARMLTLAVRLLANMFADHTVIAVWLGLVPIGVPAIFMGLGIVISVLQAFVFSLLTMIYIGLALDEPH